MTVLTSTPDIQPPGTDSAIRTLVEHLCSVMVDKRPTVELAVIALLAGGHVLLEDLPGTGKTTFARTLAHAIDTGFTRISATVDLMPTDITGGGIWNPQHQRFDFHPGPLFSSVVLVDELNRTPPRSQSAFLEAMEEGSVTVDGVRHPLPDPFFLIATQNPAEQAGTFPLPEGQLDRFTMVLHLGRNTISTERAVLAAHLAGTSAEAPATTVPLPQVRQLRRQVRAVHLAGPVLDYLLAIVEATRTSKHLTYGVSSRAALSLARCAQARAVLSGRGYVLPDDVRALAPVVLGHRVLPAGPAGGDRRALGTRIVGQLVAATTVPVGG